MNERVGVSGIGGIGAGKDSILGALLCQPRELESLVVEARPIEPERLVAKATGILQNIPVHHVIVFATEVRHFGVTPGKGGISQFEGLKGTVIAAFDQIRGHDNIAERDLEKALIGCRRQSELNDRI